MAVGFDAPRENVAEDHLGRAAFAREIAQLATSTPDEWSTRIAIYGPWGSGKTTVMNYARPFVEERGAVAIDFNPWGFADTSAMLGAFAGALNKALNGRPGANAARTAAWKALGGKFIEILSPLQHLNERAKIGVETAQKLAAYVTPDRKELEAAVKAVGARIVVFIDDIDRADPRTLPDLLFVLKQVLDIGGLSFVLALDPHVVGAALQKHHPGWADGQRFLEKIVDFARVLPEPRPDQIVRLIEAERAQHAPWCPSHAVLAARDLLPGNPRRARAFVRHLWSVKEEVVRRGEDEMDWGALVRVNLIRAGFPDLFDLLFGRANRIKELNRLLARGFRDDRPAEERREKELAEALTKLTADARIGADDAEYASELVRSLTAGAGYPFPVASDAEAAARFTDDPVPITGKEYASLRGASDVGAWLTSHASARSLDATTTLRAAVTRASRGYSDRVGRAADAQGEPDTLAALDASDQDLRLLESLLFDHGGVTQPCRLTGEDVALVLYGLVAHAHFRNLPRHRAQRAKERRLLARIVFAAETRMLDVLEVLQPWDRHGDGREFAARTRRIDAYHRVVTCRAAEELVAELAVAGFATGVTRRNRNTAPRYLLLSSDSPFWTGRSGGAALALLSAQPVSAAVAGNALDLVRRTGSSIRVQLADGNI